MNITIHRGTRQIGGSCVELACDGKRIIIDAGMPLDADSIDDPGVRPNVSGLFCTSPDNTPVDALIISHAHQDHYGLLDSIRTDVPVYMSEGAQKLINLTRLFTGKELIHRKVVHFRWKDGAFEIGPFKITPHLVDHSAFDAFAFEVEAGGKRIFYSGDFRCHGPISKTMDIIADRVRPGVDALIMEGTMLGRADEEVLTENELTARAVDICNACPKAVLVCQSGQNVSRAVSFYKAARQTNRECILDFYTAHVLSELSPLDGGGKLPRPGHPELDGVRVWYPHYLTNRMVKDGHANIPNRYARWKRTKTDIAQQIERSVLFVRPGMQGDLARIQGIEGSTLIYSLWEGYKRQEKTQEFIKAVEKLGITIQSLHTSGHAIVPDLQRLVDALAPKTLVPIHTEHPENFDRFGVPVAILEDGVPANF